MLKSLSVENFAVTKSAHLEFGKGFCALTGETGAGKSMLVDALAAALGARADSTWVRQGCAKATVSAVFEAGDNALTWLRERGIDCEDGEVSLRRAVESKGGSKAWINGTSVSAGELREIGGMLAAIHGQHESVALLSPKAQREHLDQYAGNSGALSLVASAYESWTRAKAKAHSAKEQSEGLERERSQLAWEIDEIARLAPVDGEWESVESDHSSLSQAAEIQSDCEKAIQELGDDGAISSRLGKLAKMLGAYSSTKLAQASESLAQASELAADAARDLSRFLDAEDMSAARLASVEARMGAFHDLSRKLRIEPGDLPRKARDSAARLAELEAGMDLGKLAKAQAEAYSALEAACDQLGSRRRTAAAKLGREASSNLGSLGMGKARVAIEIDKREPGPEGSDSIEFCLVGYEGSNPLPLSKCASGGELARIGLALCAASIAQDQPGCMVFDEVDAGIGGPTASMVGKLLAKLGSKGQALAVTHLPQVASMADRHYAVGKKTVAGETQSVVKLVSGSDREGEIARMLGSATEEAALSLAQALLGRQAEDEKSKKP